MRNLFLVMVMVVSLGLMACADTKPANNSVNTANVNANANANVNSNVNTNVNANVNSNVNANANGQKSVTLSRSL